MIAAVLGDFSFFTSVNDAVLGEANDVRHAGISGGNTDEPRGRRAGVNLCQTGGGDGFAVHADGRVGIIHEELWGVVGCLGVTAVVRTKHARRRASTSA